ncbi:MAG: tRNA lysidine(34) synthetase TilS [Firmicutes bacterium]|nr:tRNA lysidine(34) synthetase TilS [Bacillota bacterium]MBQ9605476.1 tRNA lysidine(34) synthetase TilS [Bacillota bacterium]
MLDKIIGVIEQFNMLKRGDHVVIGLSGGADSICLAHILMRLKNRYALELTAVHLNHNIRTEGAVHDMNFVRDFCENHELDLRIFSADVMAIAKENSLTVEEAGRQQRYLAFRSIGADKIAVAHNLNDNAETMLMRLCRGTGLKGMGGIMPVRGNIIRPLIMTSRAEIERYCKDNGLEYCIDETNLSTDYTRNKIRHCILPLFEQINPNTMESLGKNAFLFRQENDYIESMAQKAYADCADGNSLLAEKTKALEKPLLYRVLRIACENAVGLKDIALEHIEIIEALLDKPSGKKADLPKGLTVYREYDRLIFAKTCESLDIKLEFDKPIKLEGKNYLLSEKEGLKKRYYGISSGEEAGESWHIRTRRSGDLFNRADGKKIKMKKVFIDKKIPKSQRESALLLANGENVYWCDCITNKFGTPNIYLYIWEEE